MCKDVSQNKSMLINVNEIFILNIYCEDLFYPTINSSNEFMSRIGKLSSLQALDKCEECFEWIKFGAKMLPLYVMY